ncbi:MAG: hypothetical protein ABIW30_05415 [Arenimonas sp.]
MSNVIQFLEKLGRGVGGESAEVYCAAVEQLGVDEALRDALLRKDQAALNALLGARHNVMMALVPAEPERDEPERDEPRDDDEVRAQRASSGN